MDRLNRKVYTIPEVATQLGISRAAAYRLAHHQVFPSLTLGRRVLVPKEKFDRWLENGGGQAVSPITMN